MKFRDFWKSLQRETAIPWKLGEELLAVAHHDRHRSYEPPQTAQKGDVQQEEENAPSARGRAESDVPKIAFPTIPCDSGHG